MLSLDNAYNEDELRAFDERLRRGLEQRSRARSPYVAELKIDGLSIALQYRDGRLVRARDARRRRRRARTSRRTSAPSRTSLIR